MSDSKMFSIQRWALGTRVNSRCRNAASKDHFYHSLLASIFMVENNAADPDLVGCGFFVQIRN